MEIQHINLLCSPENYSMHAYYQYILTSPHLVLVAIDNNKVVGYVLAELTSELYDLDKNNDKIIPVHHGGYSNDCCDSINHVVDDDDDDNNNNNNNNWNDVYQNNHAFDTSLLNNGDNNNNNHHHHHYIPTIHQLTFQSESTMTDSMNQCIEITTIYPIIQSTTISTTTTLQQSTTINDKTDEMIDKMGINKTTNQTVAIIAETTATTDEITTNEITTDEITTIPIRKTDPSIAYIASIAVLRPYRKRGIATQLMKTIQQQLIDIYQVKKIELDVYAANYPAIRLYSGLGYVLETFEKDFYAGGVDGCCFQLIVVD
jgi:ribosomal protein S18 acetylase RimI-like enzyme